MSLVVAAPASESPSPPPKVPPAYYLARLEALAERLMAAFTPHEVLAFLWAIFFLYLALLAAWRLDYLCQRLIDHYLPPPELPRPQPTEHHAAGDGSDAAQ